MNQPESVRKSGDKLSLSTFAPGGPAETLTLASVRREVSSEIGVRIRAYEVATELGIHPTQYSHLESGRLLQLPSGIGRQQALAALKRVAERKAREQAAEGDAA